MYLEDIIHGQPRKLRRPRNNHVEEDLVVTTTENQTKNVRRILRRLEEIS